MKTFGAWQISRPAVKSRTGSQRSMLLSDGLAAKYVVTNSHVYPSGAAARDIFGRDRAVGAGFGFNMMVEVFHCPAMFCVTMRPNTSATLPADRD